MNYEDLMKRAISLADQYKYTAKPNPVVGCIIVKNKTVISEVLIRSLDHIMQK